MLTFITRNQNYVFKLLEKGFLDAISPIFNPSNEKVSIPIIRILGNILQNEKISFISLKQNELFNKIVECLDKDALRKETSWLLSNIAGGPLEDQLLILKKDGLIVKIQYLMATSELAVKRELLYVITNLCSSGDQIVYPIINYNVIEGFYEILEKCESEKEHLTNFLNFLCDKGFKEEIFQTKLMSKLI